MTDGQSARSNAGESVDVEAQARMVAHICGSSSGAAKALRELDERRAQGRDAWMARHGKTWLVLSEPDGQAPNP